MRPPSILFALLAQVATVQANSEEGHLSLLQTRVERRSHRVLSEEGAEQATEEGVEAQSLNEWMSVQQLVNLVQDFNKEEHPGKLSVEESYALKSTDETGPSVNRFTRTVEMDPEQFEAIKSGEDSRSSDHDDVGLLQAQEGHPHHKKDSTEEFAEALEKERGVKDEKDSEDSEDEHNQKHERSERVVKWKPDWPSLVATKKAEKSKVTAQEMYSRVDSLIKHAKTVRDAFKVLAKVGEGMPALGFIKTHRTGSSTIASLLHRLGDERNLLFLLPGGSQNGLGWPAAFPGEGVSTAGNQFDIICNNAVFNKNTMDSFLKPAPLYFTVLRKPVAQLVSAFEFFMPPAGPNWEARVNWMQKLRNAPNDPALGKRGPSLVAQFRNSQAHDLGWYTQWDGKGVYDHDDSKIDTWLEEMDDKLGFVMLTEYFDEGLVLLRRKLSLEIEDLVYYKMKQAPHKMQAPNAQQMARMREYNHVDVKLYEHYNNTFFDAWEKAGGYKKLGDELEELRARNEALNKACESQDEDGCPWSFHTDSVEYTEYLRKKQIDLATTTA